MSVVLFILLIVVIAACIGIFVSSGKIRQIDSSTENDDIKRYKRSINEKLANKKMTERK